jgi:hypothetical protein
MVFGNGFEKGKKPKMAFKVTFCCLIVGSSSRKAHG